MKGKGKGSGEKGGGDRQRLSSESDKDCPLQFPDLKAVDHARMCPRYTAVLQRSEEDGIGIEELDTLQTELETLLASVAKRMRELQKEITVLNDMASDKGKSTLSDTKKGGKVQQEKRGGKGGDERPTKRFKESSGKATSVIQAPRKGKGQGKIPEAFDFPDSPKPPPVLPLLPKNEAPNRFWTMVEPYCAEITKEDCQVLEEVLRAHEDDAEYHKVPSLGKHYSQKWAAEDMMEEQREGRACKISEKRRSTISSTNGSNSNDATSLLKRTEDRNAEVILPLEFNSDDDSSPFGPLTQRLVSALIEENIMTPLEDSAMAEADAAEAASMSPRSLARQLNIGNAASLERRIKRELEEQGILELDERTEENPDDEILCELRRKQQELKVLSQHNLSVTKRLFKLAKDEMARQDLMRRLLAADAEVMDTYRKIQQTRAKKKPPTKKKKVPTATLR